MGQRFTLSGVLRISKKQLFSRVSRTGGEPRKLAEEEAKSVPPPEAEYSDDRRLAVFVEDDDVFVVESMSGKKKQVTKTLEKKSDVHLTKDGRKLYFTSNNNLYLVSLEDACIKQLTSFQPSRGETQQEKTQNQKWLEAQQKQLFQVFKEEKPKKEEKKPLYLKQNQSVVEIRLSPDEKRVLFILKEEPSQAKMAAVPKFVSESGYTEELRPRRKVGDLPDKRKMGIVELETQEVSWVDHGVEGKDVNLSFVAWPTHGLKTLLFGSSSDFKDCWYFLLDLGTGKTRILDHLHDDAWVKRGRRDAGWMPDEKRVFFLSEKDGYNHLYIVAVESGETRQLTSGRFEVSSPTITKDKSKWYFQSNEADPGESHFYMMPLEGGERVRITSLEGKNEAYLSPDENMLALVYSYSNKPSELYLQENKPGAEPKQVTLTPSERFKSYPWVAPEIVSVHARDGALVRARLYKPRDFKKGGPAVIFVHGAGYMQNVHKWWSTYYREYMFHHVLMERGYIVLDMDYRGSAGYGREWRTAIYRHMGGKDLADHVDGADYLVKEHMVDPKRIGIYGGSYGGFITLMALFVAPDVFGAGAALRPVTDWAHYNHDYAGSILNLPQDDDEAYKRSSPIYFADGLKKPLLICHGMVDTNVHFQDTVRLAQRLIELRKENWEVAMYPVEDHSFKNDSSWADEYKRILRLFETNLRN